MNTAYLVNFEHLFHFNLHVQISLQNGPKMSHNLQNYLTFNFRHRRHMFGDVVDAEDHLLTMPREALGKFWVGVLK